MSTHALKKFVLLLLALGTTVALAACGSSSSGDGSGGSGEITVGIPTDDASFAPLYLAQDEDLYGRYGLKVKLVSFEGGADLAKAVAGGSIDVAVSALSEMLLAVQQHQALRAFYGGYNQPMFTWFGNKDVTSVQQAEGKKWAVTKIGSSTDFLTRYLLKRHGINPESGVQIIGVGGSVAQIAALRANQVDATSASPLTAYQLQSDGYPVIARQSDFAREFPNHVAYAKSGFLADHRGDVQRFLQGMVAGFNEARSDPGAAADAVAKHMNLDRALALRAVRDSEPLWFADGRLPDAQGMDVFWQIGELAGQWPRPIPESQWLDRSFIDTYPQWSKPRASS